mmetsp:Transcript_16339/g.33625  ORF Transcript_16339/g.33625 Transcript_16339/m.33625 type:complete len:233 (-) Transcript_16339:3349-4047(-)
MLVESSLRSFLSCLISRDPPLSRSRVPLMTASKVCLMASFLMPSLSTSFCCTFLLSLTSLFMESFSTFFKSCLFQKLTVETNSLFLLLFRSSAISSKSCLVCLITVFLTSSIFHLFFSSLTLLSHSSFFFLSALDSCILLMSSNSCCSCCPIASRSICTSSLSSQRVSSSICRSLALHLQRRISSLANALWLWSLSYSSLKASYQPWVMSFGPGLSISQSTFGILRATCSLK